MSAWRTCCPARRAFLEHGFFGLRSARISASVAGSAISASISQARPWSPDRLHGVDQGRELGEFRDSRT